MTIKITTALTASIACWLTVGVACKTNPREQASGTSNPAAPPKPANEAEPPEWFRGPDLSSLPNEGQFKRPPKEMEYLQPFGTAAFLAPEGATRALGLAHFQDTTDGLRVTVSAQGLEPGIYVLRADEFFYDPREGDSCADAQKTKDPIDQPVPWTIGPLKAGGDGTARFDKVYSGIGNRFGSYRVPAQPVHTKDSAFVSINLKQFGLTGRKLTLHKWNPDAQPQLGDPVACAIIQGDRPFGEATMQPLPGQSIKGTAYFEQDEGNRTLLELELSELSPGKYRLVVHEFADCANATGTGVGEPYQPDNAQLVTKPNYVWPLKQGDLGTFTVGKDGIISKKKLFHHPLTSGSPHIIRGRAIVVERLPEPPEQTPTPVACGMVTGF